MDGGRHIADSDKRADARKWVAELIGTFFLTFAGVSAIIGTQGSNILVIAFAHGGALAIAVYAFGPVSGGHVNPAISLSIYVAGKMSGRDLVAYIIFQLMGAVIGAFLAASIFPTPMVETVSDGATLGAFTQNASSSTYNLGSAFALELVMTFFLASAVASVVRGGDKMASTSGLVIGGALFACIMFGGPWTGASLNPARTMGPALANPTEAVFGTLWLYWAAPLVGGAIAGIVNAWIRNDMPGREQPAPAGEAPKSSE